MFSKTLYLILSPASKVNSPAASSEADTCWKWNVNSLNALVIRNQKEHEEHVLVYEKQGESSPNTFVVTAFKIASSSSIYQLMVWWMCDLAAFFSLYLDARGLETSGECKSGDVKFYFSICLSCLP